MTQTPSEYFQKPIIGTIRVEDIFNCGEGAQIYEVIGEDNSVFICNTWYKEHNKVPQLIPKCLEHWTKLF